jgi:hypothetical protein
MVTASISTWRCRPVAEQDKVDEEKRKQSREGEKEATVTHQGKEEQSSAMAATAARAGARRRLAKPGHGGATAVRAHRGETTAAP